MTTKKTATPVRRKSAAPSAVSAATGKMPPATATPAALLSGVRELILASRQNVAQAVNSALVMLYWQIGQRIRKDILDEKRAEYGEKIVAALGRQLEQDFGRGFGQGNLFRMIRFAEVFPDIKIVSALRTQLGWSASCTKPSDWHGRVCP